MGFLFDGLDAESYDRSYTDWQLVRRIAGYIRPQSRRIAIAAVAVLLTASLDALLPVIIGRGIDAVAIEGSGATLAASAALLVVLGSLSWIANALRQSASARAIGDVVLQLRQDAFQAVTAHDLSFYDRFATGKIVSRVTSDTQTFAQVMTLTMDLVSRLMLVVVLLGYLFWVSWQLSLVLLALAPLIVAAALGFRHVARNMVTYARRMNAALSATVQETVSGIRVAKTFRQEPAIYAHFAHENAQAREVNLRTRVVFASIFPLLGMLAGVGTAALAYRGAIDVRGQAITPGEWYLFIQGLGLFWFPLTSIASFWSQFQQGLAAGERIFALIDAEPQVRQSGAVALPHISGRVTFTDVDFAYKPAEPVLQQFSLDIAAGETIALVGHTGSGKSSIARLIARFYEFQGGRIAIDGHDIRDLDLEAFRARLGIVTQTPFLFDGTVRENIRYGRRDADDAAIERVARGVGGGDWIESLPDGLETRVGERGAALSLGQRQLVALARVLLQDPAILIMDEATASIDPLTETLIQEGLDTLLAGRTAIVIAHRLSTVRHADRIIVLRRGTIIEQGDHEALLAAGGHYAELYTTYFRHQSLEAIEAAAEAP
ncbi:MAG: ABC transporter ATP-binding protein/permease [Chloroflexi bacterium]|nr:ABC transporter ATP-binding protein/permease [Chloroflexota bacterium]